MTTAAQIAWTPIRKEFGARVEIDLSADLSDSTLAELARLFDERHLLVFPNQDIDLDTQRKVVGAVGRCAPAGSRWVASPHGAVDPRM